MRTLLLHKNINKYLCFLLLVMIVQKTACAQDTFPKAEIHFPSNGYKLSSQNINTLDSAISLLMNIPKAYQVDITGHTDNTGSPAYNKDLSYRRANEVAHYLTSKKFKSKNIYTAGKGDKDPVGLNDSEIGKALNRRVIINFELKLNTPSNIGGLSLAENGYKFDNDKGGIFKYPSGTSVYVPSSAFMDGSGKDISGNISLQYREYRNVVDFILRGIPMSIMADKNLYHFNSAGMFEILAFQNNKPVYLKPGKTIDIGFMLEQQLPNINFYRFDTIQQRWAEIARLTTGRSGVLQGMPNDFLGAKEGCSMEDCPAFFMIVNVGIRFSKSDSSITDKLSKIDSLHSAISIMNKRISKNSRMIDSLNKKSGEQISYKVNQQPSSKSSTLFTVLKKDLINPTGVSLLDGVTFKSKTHQNNSIQELVFNKQWRGISFSDPSRNGKYVIHFISADTALSFYHVEIIPEQKMSKRERKQYKANLISKSDSIEEMRISTAENLNTSVNTLALENKKLTDKLSGLVSLIGSDSLFCFWDKSKAYMDSVEKIMKFETWLKYFDEHKAKMFSRYSNLQLEAKYKYCLDLAAQTRKIELLQKKAEMITQTANAKASQMVQSLSISRFGIYNCDQLQRLNNPVEVFADYVDTRGKKIEPLIIYVLDKTLNGMLMYDGHYGFSPYRFAYSPSSRTSMIAIDEYGNSYIFSAKSFGQINQAELKDKYTFKLTKIGNLDSSEKLKELL